jgi:hypothetical protein
LEDVETKDVRLAFEIVEKSAERRQVFGWASVAQDRDGHPVVDLGGDLLPVAELEKAAYGFVKESRQGGEMHEGAPQHRLIASVVFTEDVQKALKVPPGTLPVGWFVGFEVTAEAFERVRKGSRLQFSIQGRARRERVG